MARAVEMAKIYVFPSAHDGATGARVVRLRELRVASGMTQTRLAAMLGVEPVTVRRWEHGTEAVPVEYRVKVANYFGVSMAHLMGWDT